MLDFLCLFYDLLFFFFKQKTAYEMRISDWSSDVCSSDLIPGPDMFEHADRNDAVEGAVDVAIVDQFEAHMVGHARILRPLPRDLEQIGRASCRERVCQYV